jgi:hypothetical protein
MGARRQLAPTDLNGRWGFNADSDLFTTDFQDGNRDALPDDELLARPPR